MTDKQPSQVTRNSFLCLTLKTEISIAASAGRVWNILTDFSRYREWNASIPHAQGEPKTGSLLEVEIHWPGLKRSPYRLEVLAAEPERELRWLGRFGKPGLMDGNHAFLIMPAGSDRCSVIQTERFEGWLVPFFTPWLRNNVLNGFEQMNASLKERAESKDVTRC